MSRREAASAPSTSYTAIPMVRCPQLSPSSRPVKAALHPVRNRLYGHCQTIDAYLLTLASVDAAIRNLAAPQHLGILTILPRS